MKRLILAAVIGGLLSVAGSRPAAQSAPEIQINAPASLEAAVARIRGVDQPSLDASLARAGLVRPSPIEIDVIAEHDARARQAVPWVVGRAFGDRLIWIFPERVTAYPYDSTESVVRHEIAHLALSRQAGGYPLPRWFHEGVAVSVDAGWNLRASMRLLLTAADRTGIDGLEQLFDSPRQPDGTEAYLLAASLVDDLRDRYGEAVPGAIAARVGGGMPFARAFAAETGETPDEAAARVWQGYRRWSQWVPLATDPSAVWTFILLLSFVAFAARLVQRARRRRAWDEEEAAATAQPRWSEPRDEEDDDVY